VYQRNFNHITIVTRNPWIAKHRDPAVVHLDRSQNFSNSKGYRGSLLVSFQVTRESHSNRPIKSKIKNMASVRNKVRTESDVEEFELTPMDSPADMIAGYRRFRASTFKRQVSLYRELGRGQEPSILLIACADSRADPSAIFDAAPGQLFVIRNVANLVPPYISKSASLHGVSAALEYAVTVLKVKHVVVMGHGGCGGVAAALQGGECGEFIGPWVRLLSAGREKVLASGSWNPQ